MSAGGSGRFLSCALALAAILSGGCGGIAGATDAGQSSDVASAAGGAAGSAGTGAGGSTGAGGATATDAGADGTSDVRADVAMGAGGTAGNVGGAGGADAGTDSSVETDAGDASGGDAGDASGTDGGGPPPCGFVMPNPVASGLPNPAHYDTSVSGIVTDQVTGLSWERQMPGHTAAEGCTVNITGLLYCPLRYAAAYCAANHLGGYSDWRLPTLLEAASLVDFTQWYPAIDSTAFPDTPYENLWTSTRVALAQDNAWYVSFAYGSLGTAFIDESAHVRCVRAGGGPPPRCAPVSGRYQPSADLIFDTITGLTWQKGVGSSMTSPVQASTYCSGLGGGFRVPSIKELLTLVDYRVSPSQGYMLDRSVFDQPTSFFWSSSASLASYMGIWVLDLYGSGSGAPSQAGTFYTNGAIKCVK